MREKLLLGASARPEDRTQPWGRSGRWMLFGISPACAKPVAQDDDTGKHHR
jgi:hypothetical protein